MRLTPTLRDRLRDFLLLPVLVAYALLLLLASLEPELRPAFLDAPRDFAVDTLERFGIRAGIPVFGDPAGGDFKRRADCVVARAVTAAGDRIPLYRTGGACSGELLRLRLPPVERTLWRMLRQAQMGLTDPQATYGGVPVAEIQDQTVRWIGRFLCNEAASKLPDVDVSRVEYMWYSVLISYSTGAEIKGSVLGEQFDCHERQTLARGWLMSPATTARFWGGPPWE